MPVGDDHRLPITLGPCDGRLLMGLPSAIAGVTVAVPGSAKPGTRVALDLSVNDSEAKPIAAVIPVRIEIRDANGRLAEGSGPHAAENGRLHLDLDLAPNEDPGTWEITVRELASRKARWRRCGWGFEGVLIASDCQNRFFIPRLRRFAPTFRSVRRILRFFPRMPGLGSP